MASKSLENIDSDLEKTSETPSSSKIGVKQQSNASGCHQVTTGKKTGLEASPIRKSTAMKRAQELETDLSDECVVGLIDLFQAHVAVADTYLSLSHEAIRKKWV